MFRLIAQFLSFLWRYKKRALAVAFLALLFFAVRFPWTEVAGKIVRKAQKQAPGGINLDFQSIGLSALPPGLVLRGLSLSGKPLKEPLLLDNLTVSMNLWRWLALKKAWTLRGQKEEFSFAATFWRAAKKSESGGKIPYFFMESQSSQINMAFFQPLWPKAKTSGRLSFRLQYEGDEKNMEKGKGFLEIKGSQIKWLQTRIDTKLGPLELPPLAWSEGKGVFRLKEGDIIIESLSLGGPSDDLYIQIRGNGEIARSYKKFRLGSYDFQVQIDADKDFPLSFLDLMLSGMKEKIEGRIRYKARITGRGLGPPDIEKLSKF